MRRKVLALFLVVCMIMALVPTAALAAVNIDAASYYYDPEDDSESKFIAVPQNKFQNGPFPDGNTLINLVSGDSFESNATVTIKKYPDNVNDNNKVYSCVGFAMSGSNMLPDESKVHLFGNSDSYTYTIQNSDIAYSYVIFYFLWQELSTNSVTYDFSGPNNTTVYPVIAKYELNDKNGPWEPPYSLSYFTVPRNTEWVNLIGLNDAPKMFPYAHSVGVVGTGATNALKDVTIVIPDDNKLTVNVAPGDPVTFPRLAQHRNVTMNPNDAQSNEIFYPVVGYVAVGTNGKYYELTGWNVNGEGVPVATGLYGDEYTPNDNVTLKAVWTEVKLTDTADLSAIPEVPLLTEYEGVGPVKLSQKLPSDSSYRTGNVTTGKDGRLDYEVSLKFSDLFSAQDMPWSRGGDYFKTVDNEHFADLNIDVKLDDHLKPATDAEGFTTITIRNASLKLTGIMVNDTALTEQDVSEDSTSTGRVYTLKVKLNGAKEFTIDFDWKEYSSDEMTVQIPAVVDGDYTGDITGTGVTVTGHMDFTKAHDASKGTETGKADFTADEFVRYLLAYDETWFEKYGGENMTLTQMLQAARDVQAKLNKFELSANTLTATISPSVEKLELDQEAVTVNVNGTVTVTPVFTPDTVTNKEVKWSVDNEDIVSVQNGVITGKKPGTATVTCTSVYDETKTATVKVTVNAVVYVEPTTGGTVTITGEGVGAITGTDNAYSVASSVTVTVTPNSGNTMASEKPSVYYYDATGTKKTLTDAQITKNENGTFTFAMPDGVSTVYVSAAFVIDNGSGKTVIGDSETVVEPGAPTGYTDQARKLEIEMTQAAQDEMLKRVAQEGGGTKYSEDALKSALTTADVAASGDIYRHIQTRANIEVTSYEENSSSLNTGKLVLDIEFQYRVVASTVSDPKAVETDGNTKNAAVVGTGDGWTNFESTEATYIVVPVTDKMGEPGEWIKATHTHTDSNGDEHTYLPQYIKIANDNTVTYVNLHEGNSPFIFEALRGVKDLRIEDNGEPVGVTNFKPDDTLYDVRVSKDTTSVKFTPDFMKAETGASARDYAKLKVNDVEVSPDYSASYPTYTVNLEEDVTTLTFTYVVGEIVNQTYTITIYRGEKPTPPEEQPATPSTQPSPTYPSFRPAPSTRFYDVDQTAWYVDAINYVVKNGLMNGVSETDFAPNDSTTRAMLVTILYRLDGEPAVTKDIPFSDVAAGKWYSDAINWAAANEIVGGYGDDTFRPDRDLTREEAATILYRYASYKKYDVTTTAALTGYTDAASVQSYATAPMSWAVGTELINGTTATTLAPNGGAIRAQIAMILMRFCENIVK